MKAYTARASMAPGMWELLMGLKGLQSDLDAVLSVVHGGAERARLNGFGRPLEIVTSALRKSVDE